MTESGGRRESETGHARLTTAAVEAVSHDQDLLAHAQSLSKIGSNQSTFLQPAAAQQGRSHSPDTLSIISGDEFSELRLGRIGSNASNKPQQLDWDDEKPRTRPARFKRACRQSWVRNKGIALVLISQIFGTLMNITTRLLENGSETETGMDPFQILFARMSITCICAMVYMWYTKVEHYPLGAPGIRLLLMVRGVGGFFGVFGLYWSLQYLPLADATVLSFLGPPLACYACSKLLAQPFSKTEQIAAFISLGGVVFIAKPTSIFTTGRHKMDDTTAAAPADANSRRETSGSIQVTPHQRLAAVGMAMVGVVGAAVAYTTIRWIGKRAHPLISVNYFALWCTIVSAVVLAFVPSVPFLLPHTVRQWSLLFFIGVSGFVMQFLLTAGLAYEKSSRANNMVYTQMIFALAADLLIWGLVPSALSLAGSSLILGSAVVVAIQKEKEQDSIQKPGEAVPAENERLMHDAGEMEDGQVQEAVEMIDQTSFDKRGRQRER